MSASIEFSASTLFIRNILAHQISFSEDKLDAFREIQESFKKFLCVEPFEVEAANCQTFSYLDQTPVLINGNTYYQCKYHTKDRSALNDFIEVYFAEEKPVDHKLAILRMEGFRAFLKKHREHHKYVVSDAEDALIRKINLAISLYEEHSCANFYSQFRQAITAYFTWLNKKLYKQTLYVIHLYRLRASVSVLLDSRKRLRSILRFSFRNLDDEDGYTNSKSLNFSNFFYWQKSLHHEYQIYKTGI